MRNLSAHNDSCKILRAHAVFGVGMTQPPHHHENAVLQRLLIMKPFWWSDMALWLRAPLNLRCSSGFYGRIGECVHRLQHCRSGIVALQVCAGETQRPAGQTIYCENVCALGNTVASLLEHLESVESRHTVYSRPSSEKRGLLFHHIGIPRSDPGSTARCAP